MPLIACHNWQSVIETGCKLLSRADMRQFKALYDDDNPLCYDEHDLYREWEEVFRARPKYISIMSGLVTEEDSKR
jgi:hypothetical protein